MDISRLAEILRRNGDKVLNNESKFTISSDLFNKMISSFNLISEQRDAMNSSFHVVSSTSFKTDHFCDLQFLQDFIKRSPSLKLTPNSYSPTGNDLINISKCKSLKLLEINRISSKLVLGMKEFRRSLQYLICVRSIHSLKDVLVKCGADETDAEVWSELKEAIFTHNAMQNVDNSIEYVPWLTSLDLSHNNIEDADVLCCLSNLKYLNLSYNRLSKVPNFTGHICNRLQVFVLSNNFIENIQGVMRLTNLYELDLTENCLIEHNALSPLSYLATLQWLNLKENPFSYHPQHRTRVCCYLHMNTATVKFVLDELALGRTEQHLIGSLHPKHLHKPPDFTESLTASISEGAAPTDRSKRVRHAKISDENVPPELEAVESIATLFTIPEASESKRQLESVHKDYIKSLYIKSRSLDLDLQHAPPSSTPYSSSMSLYVQGPEIEVPTESTTYVTACDSTVEKCEEPSDVYSNKPEEPEEVPSDDDELESGESNIFLASIKGGSDDIIVIITKTHLTEKDAITMKGLGRFALDTLIKCDKIVEGDVSYLYIEFDTVRTDRSRYYRLAEDETERFHERLRSIIDSRPPESDTFIVYRCMKCSTQFAVEKQKTMHQQAVKCLSCDSDLIVEDDS